MFSKTFLLTAAALFGGIIAGSTNVMADPMYHAVSFNLPYPVTVNNMVLQPGHYMIRQIDTSSANDNTMAIENDRGIRLHTEILPITAFDHEVPGKTRITLQRVGNDYYLDKIEILGDRYGYEFPLPAAVKGRKREAQAVTVTAAD
jgi:hypothetical protein